MNTAQEQPRTRWRVLLSNVITAILIIVLVALGALRIHEYREERKSEQLSVEMDAATRIRSAISQYRATEVMEKRAALDFSDLETALHQLTAARIVDETAAHYVLAHQDRFEILKESDGMTIDARWLIDDSAL